MAKDHPTGNSGLYRAFLQLKTPEECYRFLQDVCSYSELSAMEQRYNIAELLADKCIYTEIMDKTGASSAIISRVSRVHITKSDIDDTSFRNRLFRQLQNFLLRRTGILHSLNHNIIKVFRAYGMRVIVIQAGCYSSKTLDIFFIVQRIENKIIIQLLE